MFSHSIFLIKCLVHKILLRLAGRDIDNAELASANLISIKDKRYGHTIAALTAGRITPSTFDEISAALLLREQELIRGGSNDVKLDSPLRKDDEKRESVTTATSLATYRETVGNPDGLQRRLQTTTIINKRSR